jgi:phage regulator Rha-like protein
MSTDIYQHPTSGSAPTPWRGDEAAKGNTSNIDAKPAPQPLALVQSKDEPRIDSRLLAYSLGVKHKATMNQILKYREALERFNQVTFKKTVGERKQGGGNAERIALLSEDQAFFVLAMSRNNARVIDLKVKLVQAFSAARHSAHLRRAEYLPEHRLLHDQVAELARGSANQQRIHANFSRLVNKVVGIEAGQRNRAPMATLATVYMVATRAMAGATDHRDGYQRAKTALLAFQGLLPLAQAIRSLDVSEVAA